MIAVLVSGLPPATMAAVLGSALARIGITTNVVQVALALALKGAVQPQYGPATMTVAYAQASFRAAYLVASAVRMQNAVNQGVQLNAAMSDEMRFFKLHVAAQRNRAQAIDGVFREASNDEHRMLIWKAKMDSRTSPECRAANGLTFTIADPPKIGWPGAVHPHCRCKSKKAPLDTDAKHVNSAMSAALLKAH